MHKIGHPKAIDLDAASKLDAEATLLGREVLSRMVRARAQWQTTKYAFGMRGTIIWHWYNGHSLHADRKTAHERPMPFAKLRGYREAARGIPTAKGRQPGRVYSHMKRCHEMRRRTILSHAKRNAQRRFKVV